jgi:hypothetical protein
MRIITILICVLSLQGCIFVPVLDTFTRSGLTPHQRAAELPKTVKNFQDFVFWGDLNKALDMVVPQERKAINQALLSIPSNERVVEAKLISADYSEDVYDADVIVQTKSFNKNTLAVHERNIKEKWEYHLGTGWQMSGFDLATQLAKQ